MCVDHLQRDEAHKLKPYTLGQYQCHAFVGNSQYFTYSTNQELRNEYMCAKINPVNGNEVQMAACEGHGKDPKFKWEWIPVGSNPEDARSGILKNKASEKCLLPDGNHSSANLLVANCDLSNPDLVWRFDFNQDHKST